MAPRPSYRNYKSAPSYGRKRAAVRKYVRHNKVMKARTGLGPGSRAIVRNIIRTEIARNIENKCSQYYKQTFFYSSASTTASLNANNIFPLGPDPISCVINQGVGQGDRVGNQIKTKKLLFKGTLSPAPYNSTDNAFPVPVMVKLWILYDKTDPIAEPDPWTNLFQNGNTTKGLSNDLTDMWAPVNKDRYHVAHERVFKLGFANYDYSTQSGVDPIAQAANYYINNDYQLNANFSIDLTDAYPKIVKFQDGQTTPTSRGLFAVWAFSAASGSPVSGAQSLVKLQYMQSYEYEDA